jgi:hypothetical protein
MGYGSDHVEDDNDTDENSITMEQSEESSVLDTDGAIIVRHLSFDYFRSKLVNHFDIAFNKREVKWPKQIKEKNQMCKVLVVLLVITLLAIICFSSFTIYNIVLFI